jgi:hypothetical protein
MKCQHVLFHSFNSLNERPAAATSPRADYDSVPDNERRMTLACNSEERALSNGKRPHKAGRTLEIGLLPCMYLSCGS